jgi:SAM-dependent methyltransferase
MKRNAIVSAMSGLFGFALIAAGGTQSVAGRSPNGVRENDRTVQAGAAPATQKPQPPPMDPRERWNKEFGSGIPSLRNADYSEFLAGVIKGRKPGTALDLGIGQGRNAVYLASVGWDVTGVDISDVAVEQARKNAQQKNVKVTAVVADLDAHDFGENRWDLVTSFYMHSWHRNSKTDVPARILRSLKPGGVLVMEAFRRPPNVNGFVVAELATLFKNFRIVRNEELVAKADWGSGESTELVRFVAEKPAK